MKAEILISLISAVSLHAGLFCIGGGHHDLPHSATEIEIGLEAGVDEPATGAVDEAPSTVDQPTEESVEAQQVLPPEPPQESPPAVPAPSDAPAQEPADQPPPPPAEPAPVQQAAVPAKPAPEPSKSSRPQPKTAKTVASSVSKKGSKASGTASAGGSGRGSNISSARYRFRAPLRYPAAAFSKHIGGTVVLTIEINESGRALNVLVKQSSGHRDLDAAAVQCALASRYEPYRVNGQAEPCSVVAPFRFEPR